MCEHTLFPLHCYSCWQSIITMIYKKGLTIYIYIYIYVCAYVFVYILNLKCRNFIVPLSMKILLAQMAYIHAPWTFLLCHWHRSAIFRYQNKADTWNASMWNTHQMTFLKPFCMSCILLPLSMVGTCRRMSWSRPMWGWSFG